MKTVVMIPTYNEAGNIGPLISSLLEQELDDLEILVVDDSSPDSTGEIVAGLAGRDSRIHLLSRPDRRGRGYAGRDGFLRARALGADRVVEMDGDGSHDPAALGRLLEPLARDQADLVIGSRYIPGGAVEGRQWFRDLISGWARTYIRGILGITINDPTSGYRAFSAGALDAISPRSLRSADPFIVTEVLYRCHRAGLRMKEVPIVFHQRKKGVSKLKSSILFAYLFRVWKLKLRS